MAAAQSLLLQQPTLAWKSHLFHSHQLFPLRPNVVNLKISTSLKKLSVKCFLTNNNNSRSGGNDDHFSTDRDYIMDKFCFAKIETRKNPLEIVAEIIVNILKALQKPAVAAVVLGLLFMCDPNSALSATGGRMGGSSFSSRSSTSSSSSRGSSYSSRSSSSSSSWGGSSYSSRSSSPSPSSSRRWSSSEPSSRYYDYTPATPAPPAATPAPPSIPAPPPTPSTLEKPSTPPLSRMLSMVSRRRKGPWRRTTAGASVPQIQKLLSPIVDDEEDKNVATTTTTTTTTAAVPSPENEDYVGTTTNAAVHSSVGVGGDCWFDFVRILMFVAAVLFVYMLLLGGSESIDTTSTSTDTTSTATDITSVIMLQVGLSGSVRSFQKDLNQIAETADTSTTEGLHYILTETVVALLRYPDYFISSYSSADVKKNMEEGEERFNQLSIEERRKFDEETLVNVNNRKRQSSNIQKPSGLSNEYIVITILVAAEGEYKLASIDNSNDLKEALKKLASIPLSRTLAVEVLWTPQNEDDTLSEQELLEDYPLLQPLLEKEREATSNGVH